MKLTKEELENMTSNEIEVGSLINPNTGLQVITIHQDGKTVFLEHSKIVEFLKTVNNFK